MKELFLVQREEYLIFFISLKDKNIIKVVTGIIRCGKSTLFDIYRGDLLKNDVDIYNTGSNSYMLSREFATYLTGRYMQIHMLPLSFKEFYSTKEKKMSVNIIKNI